MTGVVQAWRLWQAREERHIVRSQWLWRLAPERRARAERAMVAEPVVAGELVRILGHHEDLDEHFVLGFTARPDPISPHKRLSDGFAAMALRCGQLRMEAHLRQLAELERSAKKTVLKSSPDRRMMEASRE